MKKIVAFLIMGLMLIGFTTAKAEAADVAPKFTEHFFPSGKAEKPTDLYYEIRRNDEGKATSVYLWLTQPDDVVAMFNEKNYSDDDTWYSNFSCWLDVYSIQIDCKVDDGDWHYMAEWDKDEYPQEDQPYDLAIRQKIVASQEQKTYREGCALIDPWYGEDDENAGYLKPVIKSGDDGPYLDLEDHSLTLRTRYIFEVRNDDMTGEEIDANGGENTSFILSDWSDEITIGKNGTQEELVKPEKIEAPVLSDLTFIETNEREDGYSDTLWKVFVEMPKTVGVSDKYYSVIEDRWSSLNSILEYRVQTDGEWGEWQETYWGNSDWLFSCWRQFTTEGVGKDDSIEFRAYISNSAEDNMDSPYSNSVFCNAGEVTKEVSDKNGEEDPGKLDADDTDAEKQKCKVCGICPVQPLGICLFIWIAIILVVIIVVVIIIAKAGKKNKNNENRQ